jgi:RNA polymerase sigma-70 factor (ECF subfamily)
VRDRRLAGRLRAEAVGPPAAPGADPAVAEGLAELVETLDADRREAFVLTQVVGCSYSEAATVCGVPVGTIRSRVARARADLVEAVRAADTG